MTSPKSDVDAADFLHWGTSYTSEHQSDGTSYVGADFCAASHAFAVDWDAKRITWYVDGVERFRHAGVGVSQVEAYAGGRRGVPNWWRNQDSTAVLLANTDRLQSFTLGAQAGHNPANRGAETMNSVDSQVEGAGL